MCVQGPIRRRGCNGVCILEHLVIATLVFAALITACDTSGNGSAVSPVAQESLEGIWLKTFAYRENGEADAIVFDIDRWDFTAILYRDTEQVGGFTGSFRTPPGDRNGRSLLPPRTY